MKEFRFISKKQKDKIRLFGANEPIDENMKNNTFRTEIFNNNTGIVEGCLGVIDYKDEYIKIKVKKGNVVFTGKSLYIHFFENKTIKISGNISGVEYLI